MSQGTAVANRRQAHQQLGYNSPTTHAAHPRSVSSPHPTPLSPSSPAPALPRRRSSFESPSVATPVVGSGDDRKGHSRSKSSTSTLPSIRSLKTRFQQSLGNTFGRKGPKVVKGEEAKRVTVDSVRFSTAATVGEGPRLKGFGGPAGAANAASDMSRSASLPAKLYTAAGRSELPPDMPQLVLSVGNVDEFGVRQSVDQALASEYGSPSSPYAYSTHAITPAMSNLARGDTATPSSRESPALGRPIVIPPRNTPSPLPSPFLRSATSPVPSTRPRDSMSPQPWPRAGRAPPLASPSLASDTAPVPQRTLSPVSPHSRRILNRVSQDFARRPDEPPLSSLRKRQAEERDSVTRTLSRQGHRNSRILPGATLPAEVADLAMARSKSALSLGADDDRRESRRTSRYLAPDAAIDFGAAGEVARRGSEGRLRRRHSVSPVVTPKLSQQADEAERTAELAESPAVDPVQREEQRGLSFTSLLDRAGTGLGFASRVPLDERRPSKPFPPEFDEVPVQRVIVQQPSTDFAGARNTSIDAPAFLPVALGNVPKDAIDLDTPPSSARRSSSNLFVPPFVPGARASSAASSSSSASSYGAPSEAPPVLRSLHLGARPPSLHDPFRASTFELRQARSASSVAPQEEILRASSVPPVPSREEDDDEDADRDGAKSRAQRRKSQDHAAQRRATLAGESRRTMMGDESATRTLDEDERGASPRLLRLTPHVPSSEKGEDETVEEGEEEPDHMAESPPAGGRHLAPEPWSRNGSLARSPGDDSPFQLAAYLSNSPAASPPVVVDPPRPPSDLVTSSLDPDANPTPPSRSPAAQPDSPSPQPSVPSHKPQPPRQDSTASALTLADMESEIARMEAELARAWRSPSMYDASAAPAQQGFRTPGLGSDFGASSPIVEADSPAIGASATVTPRTARKWSILEIEKAYERMKRLLGSSRGGAGAPVPYAPSEAGSLADESASFANGEFEAQLEDVLAQARGLSAETEGDDDQDGVEVLADDDTLKLAPAADLSFEHPSSSRPSEHSFDSTHFDAKPLPGIPPPSVRDVSPPRDRQSPPAQLPRTDGREQHGVNAEPLGEKAEVPQDAPVQTPGLDDHSGHQEQEHQDGPSAEGGNEPVETRSPTARRNAGSPRPVSILGRKRTDSDASGMRRLVLPVANRLRAQGTRDSMLSLVSVDDILSQGGDNGEGFATAETDRGAFTTPPTSPSRRNPQALSPGTRSSPYRLSFGGPLRSGVGRESQRRAEADDSSPRQGDEAAESLAARMRRVSVHRLSEPPTSPRDSAPRRGVVRATSGDASTWYPQTPSRNPDRDFRSDEPFPGSPPGQEPRRDAPTSPGRGITIASIRNMDKLEVFFRYTAAKAEMEKAELERDALLDALRETRITLSDVRRQRDMLDADLRRERLLLKQVKEHLGGDPERHADRLDALVEGRATWERRAQEALEALARSEHEAELLRLEVQEARERQELLERENVVMGARLATAEMQLDERAERAQLAALQRGGLTPSSGGGSSTSGFSGSPDIGSLTASVTSTAPPSSYATADTGVSPHLAPLSRSTSNATARPPHWYAASPFIETSDALSSLPTYPTHEHERGPKDSHGSTASTTSSTALDPTRGDFLSLSELAGSPIMGQTMRFAPFSGGGAGGDTDGEAKSSYASSLVSPGSPTRGSSSLGRAPAPLEFVPSRSGHTTFRLPFAASPALPTDVEDPAEGGERSFDSFSSSVDDEPESDLDGGEGALRKRDEAFLRDLTEEVEDDTVRVPQAHAQGEREERVESSCSPEERRGKRVMGR